MKNDPSTLTIPPSFRASGSPPLLRFTEADSDRAQKEWKATCGPHSIAAACGFTLHEVRFALANYKGWMSPTGMERALEVLTVPYRRTSHLKTQELCEGINRIQWEGSWLNPGVPARIAYFHTHWVAHFGGWVLCTACLPYQWIRVESWRQFHLEDTPPTPFHITHHYALENNQALPQGGK